MKKFLVFVLVAFTLFSCSQNIDSDLQDEMSLEDELQERKEELIDYILFDDYVATDDEVLSDIEDNLERIAQASQDTEGVVLPYKAKSGKLLVSKIEKSQNTREYTPNMSFDVNAFKSKSDSSDTEHSIILSEYKIYNEDGTVQSCVTSNDKRVGAVLYISDPYKIEDVGEDYNVLDDPLIKSMVESSMEEIESITQEDIDSVTGGNASFKSKKRYFWTDRNYSNWRIIDSCLYSFPIALDKFNPSTTRYGTGCCFVFGIMVRYWCQKRSFELKNFGDITNMTTNRQLQDHIYKETKRYTDVKNKSYSSYKFNAFLNMLRDNNIFYTRLTNPSNRSISYFLGNNSHLRFKNALIGQDLNKNVYMILGKYIYERTYDQWRFWKKTTKTQTKYSLYLQNEKSSGWVKFPVGGNTLFKDIIHSVGLNLGDGNKKYFY